MKHWINNVTVKYYVQVNLAGKPRSIYELNSLHRQVATKKVDFRSNDLKINMSSKEDLCGKNY